MDSEGRYAHMVETNPKIQAILMEKFSKDNPHLSSGLKPRIRLQQLYRGSVDPCFLNSKNDSESDESLKLEIAIFETSEKCLHFHLIDILNMYKNFDQEWLKKVSEDESSANKIIRIQAVARGFLARKIKRKLNKMNKKRLMVMKEIVSTEETYLQSLKLLFVTFRNKMSDPSCPFLGSEAKMIIPASVGPLLEIHTTFLEELKERLEKWHPYCVVAELFLNQVANLQIYLTYVSTYEHAVEALRRAKVRNRETGQWVKQIFNELGERTSELNTYLITPIQRLPRYVLLLSSIKKYTPEDHPDVHELQEAIEAIEQTTSHINKKAEEAKNASLMLSLQEKISGHILVAPNRKFSK